jgi:hypothetical protein
MSARFRRRRTPLSRTAFALLAFTAAVAPAAADCRVLDPELQGPYAGDCGDGLAHGAGSATGTARYAGGFKAGAKHGHGVKVWASGDRYEGTFREDRRHGRGRYAWGPGSPWAGAAYSGEFANDRRHGQGVFEWPNGDRYEGEWRDDVRLGPTVFELRREARQRSEREAMGRSGVRVCADWPLGSAGHVRVSGTTQAADAGQIRVLVEGVPPGTLWHDGAALEPGRIVGADAGLWWPC